MNPLIIFLCAGYAYEYLEKVAVFNQAKTKAKELGKPLLNAGCGWYYRQAINESDINLDIVPRNVPNFVLAPVESIPFPDKYFGAVFCSHVVEHTENLETAMAELRRVSDFQFIIVPEPIWLNNWLNPSHRRVFVGDKVIET